MIISKISKSVFHIVWMICLISPAIAQQHPRFWNEIQQFKHQDSIQAPPEHAILFIGSSSIRKWKDIQQYFKDDSIINRGFGGSRIPDVIHFADDIISPYHPRQIVIYCGDNDAASSPEITSDSIFLRFERLYRLIRKKLPVTKITYVSIKPSPRRQKLMPLMDQANWKIRQFLEERQYASFVDVYHLMLNDKGMPRKDIFTHDMLHMNKAGYDIWAKAIRPQLIR